MHKKGFSLVELSIVLVILGLLVGGVLAGKSLIRASELRTVSTEYQRYLTATSAFRDKYFSIPGDMTNATSFWGDQATGTGACADAAVANGTPGTCNGNGDGRTNDGTNEMYRFWQHLQMAGLIEGTYTGYWGSAGGSHVVPGENTPLSKLPGAGWHADAIVVSTNPGMFFTPPNDPQNRLILGGGLSTNSFNWGKVLVPEELWNIDTKLDDGMPATGKLLAVFRSACANSTGATDYTATYKLTDSTMQCVAMFNNAY